MILLGLLAGLLTLFAAGFGVTLLASRSQSSINLVEAFAASWLLGTGVLSLLLWLASLVLSGFALHLVMVGLAVALATVGWVRRPPAPFFLPRPGTAIEWLLVGVIVLECGFAFYLSACHGLGWDGLFNWEIKARYAFLNGGVMPSSYYSDPTRFATHPAYPLWIPFTELWLYLWMGEAHQFWIKILFPLYYAAGAILLATFASRLSGRRWIGLVAAALLFFVPCLTNMPGALQVGYVDVPIGVVYLAAIGFLLLYADTGNPAAWRFHAFFLALLPWAKREGSVLWLIAAVCALLVILRRGRVWATLPWLAAGPAIILAWKLFCHSMAVVPNGEFQPITLTLLHTNFPRLDTIWRSLLTELMETSRWSIFWLMAAVAFAVLFFRARNLRFAILFTAVWAPITIFAVSFVFSGWPDWDAHMGASLSRLLLQIVPVGWIAIAVAMAPPSTRFAPDAGASPSEVTADACALQPHILRLSRNRESF
jgi:hypothetical protein